VHELGLRRADDVAIELGARQLGVAQVDVALAGAVDVAVAGVDEEELGIVAALDVARHLDVEARQLVEDGGALGRLGGARGVGVQARGVGVEDDEERGAIGEQREQLPGLGAVVVGELERLDATVERAVLGDDDGVRARARVGGRGQEQHRGGDQRLLHGSTSTTTLFWTTSVRKSGSVSMPEGCFSCWRMRSAAASISGADTGASEKSA